jgi:hypothetical protein
MTEMGLGSNNKVWDYGDVITAKAWVDRGFVNFIKVCGGVTVEGKFLIFNNDACNGVLVSVSLMTGERHLQITIGDSVVYSGYYLDIMAAKSEEDVTKVIEGIVFSLFRNDPVKGNVVEPEGTYYSEIECDDLADAISQLDHRDSEEGDLEDVW